MWGAPMSRGERRTGSWEVATQWTIKNRERESDRGKGNICSYTIHQISQGHPSRWRPRGKNTRYVVQGRIVHQSPAITSTPLPLRFPPGVKPSLSHDTIAHVIAPAGVENVVVQATVPPEFRDDFLKRFGLFLPDHAVVNA